MKIICPQCGAQGKIDDKYIGKTLKCPKCQKSFAAKAEEPAMAEVEEVVELPDSEEQKLELETVRNETARLEEATEEQIEPEVETFTCSGCGKPFVRDELIEFDGRQICATCKPAFLQKLKEGATQTESGGLEDGIAGHYDLQIGEVVSEAWSRVKGAKGTILGAVFLLYIASYALQFGFGAILGMSGIGTNNMVLIIISQLVVQLISMAAIAIFSGGVVMIGVRRATDRSINFSMLFDGFSEATALVVSMILQTILVTVGFMLLIVPGIYLAIGYGLTYPLIMEKGLGPWEAMEASRKAIHHSWFQVFGLYLLVGLIVGVSMIPLGIGLIWTVPMSVIMIGIVYRTVFGVEEK